MSEHTPLTEADIRRIKARLLDWLVDDDATEEEARPMRDLAHKMAHNLVPVIETLLAARTSTATADTGLRERVARAVCRRPAPPTPLIHAFRDDFAAGWHMALSDARTVLDATPASTEDRTDNEGAR